MDDPMQVQYLGLITASGLIDSVPYPAQPLMILLTWIPLAYSIQHISKTSERFVAQHERT